MRTLIAMLIVLVAGSAWAGEWKTYPETRTSELPMYQIYVEDDEEIVEVPGIGIVVRKRNSCPPCPYQIRTIPADEANEFLRENPEWEPFGAIIADCMEGMVIESCDYIYLRRRVCE